MCFHQLTAAQLVLGGQMAQFHPSALSVAKYTALWKPGEVAGPEITTGII